MLTPTHRVLTPVAGALCATGVLWAVRRWRNDAPFEDYVEAVRFQRGHIPFASTLWRTISAAFSVATGAPVGREGSMIQFAAAVTSWVGKRSPVPTLSVARQVSYGAAAAIAAVYSAPLAGVCFAFEIVLGGWSWTEVLPLLLSSTAGWFASRTFLGAGPLFAVHEAICIRSAVSWGAALALVMGLFAPIYLKLLRSFHSVSRWPLALVWAGALVGALSLFRPEVWGNGDVGLLTSLSGSPTLAAAAVVSILALRLLATSVCVGSGTVGGVFTPTLFAGAASGLAAGRLLHLQHPAVFAVIGMATLLSAVTQAPLMATLMAVELTGLWHLLLLLLFLNLFAGRLARALRSKSLYAIATPDPKSSSQLVVS